MNIVIVERNRNEEQKKLEEYYKNDSLIERLIITVKTHWFC